VFDALVTNPGRLRILTALAAKSSLEFVQLRSATQLTDGNLATHARRLRSAGFLAIDKCFRDGKPVTTIRLTSQGRSALESHVDRLIHAVAGSVSASLPSPSSAPADSQEDWVD
jgi:DNA-binding MarR family transcriptional regulator